MSGWSASSRTAAAVEKIRVPIALHQNQWTGIGGVGLRHCVHSTENSTPAGGETSSITPTERSVTGVCIGSIKSFGGRKTNIQNASSQQADETSQAKRSSTRKSKQLTRQIIRW